jgi:hypothetical protein
MMFAPYAPFTLTLAFGQIMIRITFWVKAFGADWKEGA